MGYFSFSWVISWFARRNALTAIMRHAGVGDKRPPLRRIENALAICEAKRISVHDDPRYRGTPCGEECCVCGAPATFSINAPQPGSVDKDSYRETIEYFDRRYVGKSIEDRPTVGFHFDGMLVRNGMMSARNVCDTMCEASYALWLLHLRH